MARYEYYIAGDDRGNTIYGDTFGDSYWRAQTFTPQAPHIITSVILKLYKSLGSPGTVTVGIRATAAGKPTGGDLCSGTTNGNTLAASPGEWREITFGAGYELTAFTKYAIVVRAIDGDIDNRIGWRADGSSPTYADGNNLDSVDGAGVAWATRTYDHMFEEYGDIPPVEGSASGSGVGLASSVAKLDVLASALGSGIGLSLASVHLIIHALASGEGIGLGLGSAHLIIPAGGSGSGIGLGSARPVVTFWGQAQGSGIGLAEIESLIGRWRSSRLETSHLMVSPHGRSRLGVSHHEVSRLGASYHKALRLNTSRHEASRLVVSNHKVSKLRQSGV